MPFVPIAIKPGVNTQPTPLLSGEGWVASNLVRFLNGLIQKLGGSARISNQTLVGDARELHPIVDLAGNAYIAAGTSQRLMIYSAASGIEDITPVRSTSNLTAALSTTAGVASVTISDTSLSTVPVFPGDWVEIVNLTSIGGLTLQGFYQVTANLGTAYTIATPTAATATVSNGGDVLSFTTTAGNHLVAVSLAGHTFLAGDPITVGVSTTVGGATIAGDYTYLASGAISVLLTPVSSATGSENGGAVRVNYLLQSAREGVFSPGYGIGPYGLGAYQEISGSVTLLELRQWSLESWGQDLIASPSDGAIYVWTPPPAGSGPAAIISQAPAQNAGAFVGMPEQILIAYGCTDPITGEQDPLLVRWTNQSDFTDWVASATNQAGSFRLPTGTRIVGGLQAPTQALLWTDQDLWSMQYVGFPFVFGFNRIGWACGLVSKRAVAKIGPNIYWMSQNEFFFYDGQAVQPLRCSVWDFVFNSVDRTFPGAIFASPNAYFSEASWRFPVAGSNGRATNYAKLNVQDGTWDMGVWPLAASMDQSAFGAPISADYAGLLQQHETANDIDGTPMDSWALSGLVGIADGHEFVFLERLLPDFLLSAGGSVVVTLFFYGYPSDPSPRTEGPFIITAATEYIIPRGRGRYVQIKIESNAAGVFWRHGKSEALIAPAGKR